MYLIVFSGMLFMPRFAKSCQLAAITLAADEHNDDQKKLDNIFPSEHFTHQKH
jgi:hypothetical protein